AGRASGSMGKPSNLKNVHICNFVRFCYAYLCKCGVLSCLPAGSFIHTHVHLKHSRSQPWQDCELMAWPTMTTKSQATDTKQSKRYEPASLTVVKVREHLAEVLNRAQYADERIRIIKHGKPVAAIVSIEDLKVLEALEDELDIAAAKRALEEIRRGNYVGWEDVKADLQK